MLRLVFRGHWMIQMLCAAAAFAFAVAFFMFHQQSEAEKALARTQGAPVAVSLNTFDPEKDIHPADEVHVIGWVNPDYNYQLTEEHRRGSDIVRRMFVLFGPEDAPDARMARAVVLMSEADVDRFADMVVANVSGLVGGNPVFSLNGTGKTYATLDDMSDDALREKGLTKAPGFRYIELWPAAGRDAGLAPAPEAGLMVSGPVAGLGVLLLLVGGVNFRRRREKSAASVTAATPGSAWIGPNAAPVAPETGATALSAGPGMAAEAAPSGKARRFRPESLAFLGLAVSVGIVGSWSGSWQLMVLAGLLGVAHFVARVKVAMDRGVAAVATSLTALKASAAADGLRDGSAVVSTPGPITRMTDKGRSPAGRSMTLGGALAVLVLVYLVSEDLGLLNASLPGLSVSGPTVPGETAALATPTGRTGPELAEAQAGKPAVGKNLPVQATDIAAPSADVAPASAAPVTAQATSDLIPRAASLTPGSGETGAQIPEPAAPALPMVVAAAPALEPSVSPVELAVAVEPAPAPAAPQAVAVSPEAQADAEEGAALMPGGLSLSGFGGFPLLAPIAGAVLLAVAAFALMRGRQAAPPAVFAGRDPWGRLAREVRGA